jgi:hypothetical protein
MEWGVMAGAPRAVSGGAVYDHTAPRGGGGFPGHPPLRPGRLFVHTGAGSDGEPEPKRQTTDSDWVTYFDDFDAAQAAAQASAPAPDPASAPDRVFSLESITKQLPSLVKQGKEGKKGNIFAPNTKKKRDEIEEERRKGRDLQTRLLDELNRQFEYLVSNQLYLKDMTLARLHEDPTGTGLAWYFGIIHDNPVYYRAFETNTDNLDPTTGQYANPAIQTVYAFAITAMLISKNTKPLERHASYVAGEGTSPYQAIIRYAIEKDSPSSLLKKAIAAVFTKEHLFKDLKKQEKELEQIGMLEYLNRGKLDRVESVDPTLIAGAGAAGPGFPSAPAQVPFLADVVALEDDYVNQMPAPDPEGLLPFKFPPESQDGIVWPDEFL